MRQVETSRIIVFDEPSRARLPNLDALQGKARAIKLDGLVRFER